MLATAAGRTDPSWLLSGPGRRPLPRTAQCWSAGLRTLRFLAAAALRLRRPTRLRAGAKRYGAAARSGSVRQTQAGVGTGFHGPPLSRYTTFRDLS